jgi:hypothetical protein
MTAPSPTYLRYLTAHDPAARIAAHVTAASACHRRERARRVDEARMRAAVSAAAFRVAA